MLYGILWKGKKKRKSANQPTTSTKKNKNDITDNFLCHAQEGEAKAAGKSMERKDRRDDGDIYAPIATLCYDYDCKRTNGRSWKFHQQQQLIDFGSEAQGIAFLFFLPYIGE